jgi:type VI secretion system ImpB/VipA family protein
MPDSITDGGMRFDFGFKSGSSRESSNPEPWRIAILGDFGGPVTGAEDRFPGPLRVDFDNFDEVFTKIGVTLDLPPCEERAWEVRLQFQKLDDFHPDQLLTQCSALAKLTELRAKLLHPASMDAAARELREVLKIGVLPDQPSPTTQKESTEEMLSRLLGKPSSGESPTTYPAGLANRLIQQLVGSNPPSVDLPEPQLAALAEAELSARLRLILHTPAFQALEGAWRGLDFLVRHTSEDVKLYVIDVSAEELAKILAAEDVARSALDKELEKIRPGLVLGIYTFGPAENAQLASIARLATARDTAFVAAASPHLVGCRSFGEQTNPDDWSEGSSGGFEALAALRRMPETAHLGLAMPRFLLRQPYGKGSDPIESFRFEEMATIPEHESYLWGNPAFLFGLLFADAFAAEGSDAEAYQGGGEVDGLPIHHFIAEGETQVKPCAEAWLGERAAAEILSHGIMPVLSVRGRDAVQFLTLQALSNPPQPLPVHR